MRKDPPKINHPYIFSVSQAQTFMLCPRKWAYNKIDGIEDPGSDSTKLGSDVHEQLEEYLEKGTPINVRIQAGKIAMAALPYLPPPRFPGMAIEEWFSVKIGTYKGKHGVGAYYRGLKDVEIRKGWKSDNPFVSDHKTTKNFMWAKTADDLTGGVDGIGDVQSGLYSHDTMLLTGAMFVDLQWTYVRTTGAPSVSPTITTISREQVSRIIRELEEVTARMIKTKDENPTASTVEQDPTACAAFGGCPYKGLCNLTPQEKMKALMAQAKKESLLERLANKKDRKNGKVPAETAESKPVETVPERETEESTDSDVNPPENEKAPVVTEETQAAAKAEKAEAKKTRNNRISEKAPGQVPNTAPPAEASGGSVLGRAFDAFWNVLANDVAERIAEKLNK